MMLFFQILISPLEVQNASVGNVVRPARAALGGVFLAVGGASHDLPLALIR
jgi:hypothetical protein